MSGTVIPVGSELQLSRQIETDEFARDTQTWQLGYVGLIPNSA